jgi:hypothetical protein
LNDPRIELTTLSLTSVGSKSITLGPGRAYPDPKDTESHVPDEEVTLPADVIVLANGYQVVKWFHPLEVIGSEGKRLDEVFEERGGPQMYMGTAMDSFPNFFTLFGPNTVTGHSSVILASENGANLALKFIKPILKGDVDQVEIKKEAEIKWATNIQEACKQTIWLQGGCNSWYKTESGWNSTGYPYVPYPGLLVTRLMFSLDIPKYGLPFTACSLNTETGASSTLLEGLRRRGRRLRCGIYFTP